MYNVYKVRYIRRPRKSEALTDHKSDQIMEHYETQKQSISELTINNHKHALRVYKVL